VSKGKFIGKWTGVALVAILAVFVAPVPESYGASTFKDTKGHWAEQNIEAAAARASSRDTATAALSRTPE
jgi:hypothetical protein